MTDGLTPIPGQTVGPFFSYALLHPGGGELVPPQASGSIRLHGTIVDGAGAPVPDALIEIWQPDAEGSVPSASGSVHRDGWTFTGWGRTGTDAHGHYTFTTVEPGATRQGGAPFFAVTVFARGLLNRLFTRAYLPGPGLASDPLLTSLPSERRDTLIAVRDPGGLRFDIRLQEGSDGQPETVFLCYAGYRP